MTFLKKLALAGAVALAPLSAGAASLDIAALGYEASATTFTISGMTAFGTGGEFFATDGTSSSVSTTGGPSLAGNYQINLNPVGTMGSVTSALGTGTAISSMTGMVEVLLEGITTTGSYVGFDGGAILLAITSPALDADVFATANVFATFLNDAAPIPLPAGGLLLITGAGALVMVRRKRG